MASFCQETHAWFSSLSEDPYHVYLEYLKGREEIGKNVSRDLSAGFIRVTLGEIGQCVAQKVAETIGSL